MTELEFAAPHKVVLTTRLSKAECLERLKAGVGHWFNLFTDKPVKGLVIPSRVLLMSSRWFTSHTPVTLKITDEPGGARIEAQAGMALASIITVGLLGFMALIGEIAALAAHAPSYVLFGPLVLLGACALAILWIAMMTRRSHTEILAYVRSLLDATDSAASLVA